MLLLRGLAEMRKRLAIDMRNSLTSRKIMSHAPLSAQGRGALGAIIQMVERTHFGAAGAGGAEHTLCRGRFETLKDSLVASGAK